MTRALSRELLSLMEIPSGIFVTENHNEIVCGPHASHGIAVVCDADDYNTMVLHAVIRWTLKRAARG